MTAEENNLPRDLQHPGGFVEETMTWINETAVCPQPIFALASALCLAGTLYGRHFKDESGQRTNLYVAECYAGRAATMKRIRPRAQGRAYRILKRNSHITIVLDVK